MQSTVVRGMGRRTRMPMAAMKEREPPRQIGTMARSKGPYLSPISVHGHDE